MKPSTFWQSPVDFHSILLWLHNVYTYMYQNCGTYDFHSLLHRHTHSQFDYFLRFTASCTDYAHTNIYSPLQGTGVTSPYLLNHPAHNKIQNHAPQYLSMIFISLPPPPHTHTHFATSVDLRKASCTYYTVFTRVTNRNILTHQLVSRGQTLTRGEK